MTLSQEKTTPVLEECLQPSYPRKAWTLSGTYQLVELAPWLSLSEYVNRGIDLLPAICTWRNMIS